MNNTNNDDTKRPTFISLQLALPYRNAINPTCERAHVRACVHVNWNVFTDVLY